MGTEAADTKRTAELYQEYMQEHRRRKGENKMKEKATGSGDPAQYVESEVMNIDQVTAEEWSDKERKWDDDIKEYVWKVQQISDDME